MSHLHLVIGPVAAGKSTFGIELGQRHRAVRLTLDDWMAALYGDDERPLEGRLQWSLGRTERCLDLIRTLTQRLMEVGTAVVLEVGLIEKEARQRFYSWIDEAAWAHTVYVVDADRDVRRQRVIVRNRDQGETYHVEVPLEFFEFASDRWEPPGEDEQTDRDMQFIFT